jgi:CheY-like chemotaxis protein
VVDHRVIFIVDDEELVRRSVQRTLHLFVRRAGLSIDIHQFENPLDALAQIDKLRPDVIISDNSMPKMTGFDFLREVRSKWPSVRTMMLSGGIAGKDIRAAAAAGQIDKLLQKPWDNEELCTVVRDLLGS